MHWEHHEVGDEGDLALHEGFGVADPGEQTVMSCGGEGALADVFFGHEEAAASWLFAVLGAIGAQRG